MVGTVYAITPRKRLRTLSLPLDPKIAFSCESHGLRATGIVPAGNICTIAVNIGAVSTVGIVIVCGTRENVSDRRMGQRGWMPRLINRKNWESLPGAHQHLP